MKWTAAYIVASLAAGFVAASAEAQEASPRYDRRWVYATHNLLVARNVDELVALIDRAGRAAPGERRPRAGAGRPVRRLLLAGRSGQDHVRRSRRGARGEDVVPHAGHRPEQLDGQRQAHPARGGAAPRLLSLLVLGPDEG